jgi:hypothetical protein
MMKEQIAKLANESGFDVDKTGTFGNYSEMHRLEKFAELIVQQCFSICEDLGDQGLDGHYCADEIKRTFGVKV